MNTGFIYLDIHIVPQIMRENTRRYFSHHNNIFFPVQNNFHINMGKNSVLLLLKSKFE